MAARGGSKNIVDPSRLNGAEKCAVILLALGEEHATIWQSLDLIPDILHRTDSVPDQA